VSAIRVDIVSDVVCPWCIVGLRQLEAAAAATDSEIEVHWHPFELNPQMSEAGQDLREHIVEKYGLSQEQSEENRARLKSIGDELDFSFRYDDNSRMVNTFKAHQLLHWAGNQSPELGHALKVALFKAYFTDQQDVNEVEVLLKVAESVGLDAAQARHVLTDGTYQSEVRQAQSLWTDRGISGVPAMVFNNKYLATGAQGPDNYSQILNELKTS